MEDLNLLKEVLNSRFPGETINALAAILLLASKKREISYEEIKCDEEMKRGLLLLAYKERLLLPVSTSSKKFLSLAWEERTLTAKVGEKYEMPNVIRHLINYAKETGCWDPEVAVKKYLEEIAEPEADKMVKVFRGIREEIRNSKQVICAARKVTPNLIKRICEKYGLRMNLNRLIVEFKGGGIINPSPPNFSNEEITYETNPSLI
ncbi:MAG: hypothetical protein ACUVQX_06755 [Candidatus Bathycorpusculaceae bacterium]